MGGPLSRRMCRIYIQKCNFLLQDQEIIRNLRDLSISLENVAIRPEAELYTGDWDAISISKSLSTHLSSVLLKGDNIESLVLASVYLDVPVMERILKLPKLRTLKIDKCNLLDEGWNPPWAECMSTLNLSIVSATAIDDQADLNANMILAYMPSLRYFSHQGSLVDSRILFEPDAECAASGVSSKALTMFERLEIIDPFPIELQSLPGWFTEAKLYAPNNRLRLTHFRLSCCRGITVEDCRQIIIALQGTPIRCLRLEGLCDTNITIISFLADAFPELEDLTLEYARPGNGKSLRATEWPELAQEYAPEFAEFTKLKSFTWNYRLEPTYTCSPVILAFEEGWSPDISFERGFVFDPFWDPCPWVDEWIFMFRMFAAYCPSLETLEFMHRVVLQRGTDGDITCELDDMFWPRGPLPERPWRLSLPTF